MVCAKFGYSRIRRTGHAGILSALSECRTKAVTVQSPTQPLLGVWGSHQEVTAGSLWEGSTLQISVGCTDPQKIIVGNIDFGHNDNHCLC